MRQEDLIRTVKNAVYDHGTKALAIDDIAEVTSLTAAGNAGSLQAAALTGVPEAARRAFTRITRLTDSQVSGLSARRCP